MLQVKKMSRITRILAVFVHLSCSIFFCVECTRSTNEYFYIETNRMQVERAAISYAKYKAKPTGRALDSKLLNRKQSICRNSESVKLVFCKTIFRTNYYGFEFPEAFDFINPDCQPQKFRAELVSKPSTKEYWLPMFMCPLLSFLDPATNWTSYKQFPYHIWVSEGNDSNSAIVYLQKKHSTRIYPMFFVSDIAFDRLARYKDFPRFDTERMLLLDTAAEVEQAMMAYLKNKNIVKPYRKFTRTLASLNVCGYRKSQKLNVCRLTVRALLGYVDLDAEGYDEYVCKKHRLRFKVGTPLPTRSHVFVLLCPPVILPYLPQPDRHPILFYVSSNTTAASATIYCRPNQKGSELQLQAIVEWLDARLTHQEARRGNLAMYPSPDERAQRRLSATFAETWRRSVDADVQAVQMPTTLTRDQARLEAKRAEAAKISRITSRRAVVEDAVIRFSTLKRKNFGYRRFRIMHTTIDVCQLSIMQRNRLCIEISDHLGFVIDEDREWAGINYECRRNIITLTSREAETLGTEKLSMWKCPHSLKQPKNVYYVGKSHFGDTVIVYKHNYSVVNGVSKGVIHPEALASNIDRYVLADCEYDLSERLKINVHV